jgi:hypothetical protein
MNAEPPVWNVMYHECEDCGWWYYRNYDVISAAVTKIHKLSGVAESELFDFYMTKVHDAGHDRFRLLNRQN